MKTDDKLPLMDEFEDWAADYEVPLSFDTIEYGGLAGYYSDQNTRFMYEAFRAGYEIGAGAEAELESDDQ